MIDVDANHAGNISNRRSHYGIILYFNNAPIIWYSKLQNTVEVSIFGPEFSTLGIATEIIEVLQYKLRFFGVPVEGPTAVFCDKTLVVKNFSIPISVLNQIHNAICYHRLMEYQAEGVLRFWWISGKFKSVDLFINTNMPGNKRHDLVE